MITFSELPEYIEPDKVAEFIGVTRETVYSWMGKGMLPHYVFGTKSVRISKADLTEFIQKSRRVKK